MRSAVILCVDSESVANPDLIGLGDENLLAQTWLRPFCNALEARSYLRDAEGVEEVWVASCDEMDPINLAAAIKKDAAERGVYLLSFDGGGSLKSRASAAGIDAVLSRADFASRYARRKIASVGDVEEGDCDKDVSGRSSVSSSSKKPVGALPAINRTADRTHAAVPDEKDSAVSLASAVSPAAASAPRVGARAAAGSASENDASLVTVVSACGGTGKSTIAALAAFLCQGWGRNTLLVDADFQLGDLQYVVGSEQPLTLDEAMSDPSKLEQLKPDGRRPAFLAAPRQLELSEAVEDGLLRAIDRVGKRFDIVVANTSSHWDERLAQLLERSSRVLFLVDQRASSLRTSKHVLEMCARCGIATGTFVFAVNRCSKGALFSSFDIACSLGASRVVELKDGGKEVDELLGAGLPADLIDAQNELCLSLSEALIGVLPGSAEAASSEPAEPTVRAKRFSFGRKKRRAACL